MKIAIVGSRKRNSRNDQDQIVELVNSFGLDDVVVSGGCEGPDLLAENAAKNRGLKTIAFLPDLPPHGSPKYLFTRAYYGRNKLIAENCDILHAFVSPDRKGGTENTLKYAQKLGIPVIIHSV